MKKCRFFVGIDHDRAIHVFREEQYKWEQTVGTLSRFVSLTEVEADRANQAIWEAGRQEGRKEAIADFLKAHEKGFQCLESNFDQCIHVDDFEVAGWAEFATSDKSVEELITEEKNAQIAASRLLAEAGIKSAISDRILAISDNGTFAEWMKPEARVCYPGWRIEDPFGILEKNNGQEYNPGTTES